MKRIEAIALISSRQLKELNVEIRKEILQSWWGIDDEDEEFQVLPKSLQIEILNSEIFTSDAKGIKYDPLILEGIKKKYYGVKNEYLRNSLADIGYEELIEGEAEKLFPCPCCSYRSLILSGEYFICTVCFWEDDGCREPLNYSSVNRMTLEEARNNYKKFGACDESSLKYIDVEAHKKYVREE